jgi:hypothetical protein
VNLTTANFTIEELESRFEMQAHQPDMQMCMDCDSGGGGGGVYYYYGSSWGNLGAGEGYTGVHSQDSNGNVMLDDGSYTDRSEGGFPSYSQQDPTCPQAPCPPNPNRGCKCNICRCRF